MVDRAAGGRVDSVGVADAVVLVVFAVVAGGDYGAVFEPDSGFYFAVAVFVGRGTFDAHCPCRAVSLASMGYHFATYVDEVVLYAV